MNPVTGDFSLSLGDLFIPERGVPLGLSLTYNSYFASKDGAFGRGWSFNSGMSLTKAADGSVTVSQENGSQVTFSHTSAGYTAPPRVIASLLEASGKFVFTRGTRGQSCPRYSRSCVTFFFKEPASSKPGRLTRISSPDGDLALIYNKGGKLLAVKDPAGRELTFAYRHEKCDDVSVSTTGLDAEASYDTKGNLTRFTNAGRSRYGFLYDAYHRMIGIVDPRGVETDIAYDSAGRVRSVTDATGETQYTHAAAQSSVTRPGGLISTAHIADGEVTRVDEGTDPASPLATTLFTYDPATLGPTAVTDPDGHTSHMEYDDLGHLTSYTDPLGHTSTYHFGAATGIVTTTDALGTVSRATTDVSGRLKSIALDTSDPALTQTTAFHYGSSTYPGDVTSVTDAEGHLWRFAYDKFGNPTKSTDPLGDSTTTGYDRMGRPSVNTALNNPADGAAPPPTTYSYDAEGRLLSTTDPLGATQSYSYDRNGNRVATVAGGHQTSYGYDAAGRLTVVTRPNGARSRLTYPVENTSIIDPGEVCDDGNNCEEYTYDDLGRPATATDALGNTSSYAYSPGGLLLSSTDANGVTTSYSHDAAGQTTGVSYSDATTHPVTYDYDAAGQLIHMTDGTGTSTFTYDSLGRKKGDATGVGMESDYVYDRLNHVTSMTLNSTPMAAYTYDAAGRMSSVKDRLGNATTFSYDASSNLIQTLFPGGETDSNGYDAAGRTVNFTIAQGAVNAVIPNNGAFRRNLLGQITGVTQTGLGQTDQAYSYDANGRLAMVNGSAVKFDSRNNLLQDGSGDTFTYDAANRLVTEKMKPGTAIELKFGYDDNGSRTSASTLDGTQSTSFMWDAAGNLASFTDGSTSETNTYDGLGRRVLFTNAGNASISVWGSTHTTPRMWGGSPTDPRDDDCDGNGFACAVADTVGPFNPAKWDIIQSLGRVWGSGPTDPSGPLATDGTVYLYGPEGLPVEQLDSSDQALFYHHDQLGSTRAVTDATSHIVEIVAYDTYGNEAYRSGSVTVPFGFGGGYTDPVSHLVLIGNDWYDPPTGQFLKLGTANGGVERPGFGNARIRRAITVGQNAPVLLRSGNPAVLSVELFFDTYEKRVLTGGYGWGSPAGIDVELFFDRYEKRVVQFGDSWGQCRGNQAAYCSFVAVPDRVMRRLGTSAYALGGGDPINGWKEFSPREEQLKGNPRH